MDYFTDEYVVINRENMTFVARAKTMEAASMIANLEPVDASFVILPLERKSSFSKFGVLELLLLYKNTTGQIYSNGIHDYNIMIQECFKLATLLPMDARTLGQLEAQHAQIPMPPVPPKIPTPPIVVRMDPNAPAYVPPPPAPAGSKAPKEPDIKPAKGSTGKVWTIADRVHAELGGGLITKEVRTKIIAACEAEGINPGTAATQYGKWKATK